MILKAKNSLFSQSQLRLLLSIFWLMFTFSLTVWWWIFGFKQLHRLVDVIPAEEYARSGRMLLWEGAILISTVFLGGVSLVILANRERVRHEQMKLFFGNFAHDLKTSMSRLRLQTEMQSPERLLENINRLDLQLENSLWVARGEEQKLHFENLKISEVLSHLRSEWPELEISLEQEAIVRADKQALRSVFRNLVQNASLHGAATRVQISVRHEKNKIHLSILNNGKVFSGDEKKLGKTFLSPKAQHGNGLGLYLTRFLVEKMKGSLSFETKVIKGFVVHLTLLEASHEG